MSHSLHISPLPGDRSAEQKLARIIRVNHAGEYGAKRIYAGQLAVMKHSKMAPLITHMAEQEEKHLEYFEQQLVRRKVRPTLLFPLWHVAGYLLGAGTALLGDKAAMACTAAVEEVIDEHYGAQLAELDASEQPLKDTIAEFRAEELEHKDTAIAHGAISAPAYPVLTAAIKAGSKLAIWLATRV
jgi:ubiquinone biosynthesis monooxygenase Coq7